MASKNSANPYEARRKKVNPYNKTQQALQTGYSQAGDNVEPTPLPYHDQNRPGHVEKAQPKTLRRAVPHQVYDADAEEDLRTFKCSSPCDFCDSIFYSSISLIVLRPVFDT